MKILFLLSRFPYPLEKGDKLRAYYQIRELSQNNEIVLVALSDRNISANDRKEVEKFCNRIYILKLSKIRIFFNLIRTFFSSKPLQVGYFFSKNIKKKINFIIKETKPEHIFCQLIRVAEYIKDINSIPKTLDYQDAFSKGIERRLKSDSLLLIPLLKLEYKRLLEYEKKVFNWFENKIIISEQDREMIHHPEKDKIIIIRNGVDVNYYYPIHKMKEYDILFAGNMSYPPNIIASEFLVNRILPLLKSNYPNIKILIAGTKPSKRVINLQSSNVEISGWIDDIRESYAKSKIFIAPMQISIGLQNKILQAMAMKIPCISSIMANNALKAINFKEILIAETAQEYADHIKFLLENTEKANIIVENAYKFIQKNYQWHIQTNELEKLIINSMKKSNKIF